MRAQDSNYWLDRWYTMLKDVKDRESADEFNGPVLVIADDVRYENELHAIEATTARSST